MAENRTLKVYRTPIGFHDAYVAAPSQKAALKAWGAEANLFARGVAEVVTDAKLGREALLHPGIVIRKARGTAAEHIDALPKTKARTKTAKRDAHVFNAGASPARKQRPSRLAMDNAERSLSEAETRHRAEDKALVEREKELAEERHKLERGQQKEYDRLRHAFEHAKREYQESLQNWKS